MELHELSNQDLDKMVAIAEGYKVVDYPFGKQIQQNGKFIGLLSEGGNAWNYSPSTNWEQGGPIMEREKIIPIFVEENDPYPIEDGPWSCAYPGAEIGYTGPTLLIAAMRCYISSKLGENIK